MKQARPSDDDMQCMLDFFSELDEMLHDTRFGASVDSEAVGALVKKHWGGTGPGVGGSWNRVLYGMVTLLENCTDPAADTLEWRRDVRDWLKKELGAGN